MKAKRILSLLLALILCLSLAPAALAEETELYTVEIEITFQQTDARSMLAMMNNMRTGEDAWQLDESENKVYLEGLGELQYSYALEEIAMQRAVEVALSHSHTRPNGERCFTCLASDGTRSWGENICCGYGLNTNAAQAFESWSETDKDYAHQGHRRNMLNKDFQTVGVAHVRYGGCDYWAQEFGYSAETGTACAADDSTQTRRVEVSSSQVTGYTAAQLNPASLTLTAGETADAPQAGAALTISGAFYGIAPTAWVTPDWQSADESVATVADGAVTAVGAGETSLSATVFGGQVLSVPVTVNAPAQTLADGHYLIRPDWTVSAIDPAQKFEPNGSAQGEYLLTTDLSAGEKLKVVKVVNGAINAWYPDGTGNEYTVDEAHAGHVTVYFRDAYYPDWASFGGYIYIGQPLTPAVYAEVYGASLSLKGLIGLNFYLFLPQELLDDSAAYVTVDGEKQLLSDAPTQTIDGRTAYQFNCLLSAKEMRRSVPLKVFDGQDQPYPLVYQGRDFTEAGYSCAVQDYLDKVMADCDALLLLNLVRAMNDYGSCAQLQFNYDAENRSPLVTAPENVTAADLASYAPIREDGENPGLRYVGSSLLLKSGTVLRHYFQLKSGSLADYTVTLDGQEVQLVKQGKYWVLELDDIPAKDLDKFQLVQVTKGNEALLSLNYCPLSYAQRVLDGGSEDADLQLLCKALFRYWQAAEAYFA